MMKARRVDIFGHQTTLRLEPEYWDFLYEIADKFGVGLRDVLEAIAAHRNPSRSFTSEVRVAIAAHFHGSPYPIRYRDRSGVIISRTGGLHLAPSGRPRKKAA
jgi:Ribbon-helix-helix domain